MRLFIIEGLGGAGNSMDRFYQINERQNPNDKRFKMLYNPECRYKERAYMDLNCSMKLIKLRTSLSKTMQAPDIYLRSKVPEDMYDTLVKFAEMRKLDRINLVANFDLFPSYGNLMVFERKYGDSISYYDQHGVQKKKKKKRVGSKSSQGADGPEGSQLDREGSIREGTVQ